MRKLLSILAAGASILAASSTLSMAKDLDAYHKLNKKTVPMVYAIVDEVIDGDTIKAVVHPWPDDLKLVSVRVFGIDTPEKKWRAKCDEERELGEKATALAKETFKKGDPIILTDVEYGKYASRVVANVLYGDGNKKSWGPYIVSQGLAKSEYFGGKKQSWCK